MTVKWHCRECDRRGTNVVPLTTFLTQRKTLNTPSDFLDAVFAFVKKLHKHKLIGIHIETGEIWETMSADTETPAPDSSS